MIRKYSLLVSALAIFGAAASARAAADKIAVRRDADRIVISGGQGQKLTSDKFALSRDAWYVVKIAYTGPDVSICQLSLATPAMIAAEETVGGLLTNWMGPRTTEKIYGRGSMKSEDYVIFLEEAEGPWQIEILPNPKPEPVSDRLAFSGAENQVTPFFHLKAGQARFTMNQKLKGQFSARLEVDLYNGDTGEFVTNLCHNSTDPTLEAEVEVKAAGNYVLQVAGGDSWDISGAQ